jgi:hypothetical protein
MRSDVKYRPPLIRLVNSAGSLATSAGWVDRTLDANRLMDLARRRTGLEDFGSDDFLEPFGLLVASYNTEARLNFVGRLSAKMYLVRLLENRLRMEQDRKRYPQIAEQTIRTPVFILGLPRTGSTLLFELMARNKKLRVPMSWEVMLPSPPPRAETFQSDPRIKKAQCLFNWVDRIAPEFKYIHEVGALRPQECLAIIAQAFRSVQFHTTNHVPSYQAWLDSADLTPAYQYHRRLLQQLQVFSPPGTWLLKAPAHLFGIEALFRVYPDARIVQTHRDPVRVIASISSHCVSLRQAFSEHMDLNSIGSTWCRLWTLGLERTLQFRRDHPELEHRFLDLPYDELTADPVSAVRKIHEAFNLPFDQEALSSTRDYLSEHPKNRLGTHRYRLEDYGITPKQVGESFRHVYGTAIS